MAIYVFAGKIVRRGSGYLSSGAGSPASAPEAPSINTITTASTQLTITWTDPLTNVDGSALGTITTQTVRWGPNFGEQNVGGASEIAGRISSVAAGTHTKTITGLTSSAETVVTVTTTTANGESEASTEVSIVVA